MDKTEVSDARINFQSLKDDPEAMLSLVNKYVQVQLIMNKSFCGFIHSIDPITCSIILSVPKEDQFQITVLPGHAVIDIQEKIGECEPPIRIESTQHSDEDVASRKKTLIAWLKSNLLPVSEESNNVVVGSASVLPPYTVMDIYAETAVIALQIRNMVEKMPQDFVAK